MVTRKSASKSKVYLEVVGCPYTKKEIEKILSYGKAPVYATCDQPQPHPGFIKPLGDGERKDVWFRVSRIRIENSFLYARALNTDIWYPVAKLEVRQ